jgi:hypothetical protein
MKPAKIADYGITEEFGYLPSYEPAQSLSAMRSGINLVRIFLSY